MHWHSGVCGAGGRVRDRAALQGLVGVCLVSGSRRARDHWKRFQTMITVLNVLTAAQVVKTLTVSVEETEGSSRLLV